MAVQQPEHTGFADIPSAHELGTVCGSGTADGMGMAWCGAVMLRAAAWMRGEHAASSLMTFTSRFGSWDHALLASLTVSLWSRRRCGVSGTRLREQFMPTTTSSTVSTFRRKAASLPVRVSWGLDVCVLCQWSAFLKCWDALSAPSGPRMSRYRKL